MRCRRDTKSVYWKALMGEIQRFTGISDPYDAFSSDVNLRSDRETAEQTSGKSGTRWRTGLVSNDRSAFAH